MTIIALSLSLCFILTICLLSPDIVFMIHKRHFIWKNTDEWGYSTPKQYRYSKGDSVIFHQNEEEYVIVETGRHDYLITKRNGEGDQRVVLQNEIKLT